LFSITRPSILLQGPDEFQREVEVLSTLRYPHIVMLMGCCPEKGCPVYEYCANGSLEDRLARKGDSAPLPWYTRIRITFEVGNFSVNILLVVFPLVEVVKDCIGGGRPFC
jgi:serine/threonine protein kinase